MQSIEAALHRASRPVPLTLSVHRRNVKLGVKLDSTHGCAADSSDVDNIELREFMPPIVSEIELGSPAAGLLVLGDALVAVNGERCTGAMHAAKLIRFAREADSAFTLDVLRPRSCDVRLDGHALGMTLADDVASGAVVVRCLRPDGAAMASGLIVVGCRVVSVGLGVKAAEPATSAAAVAARLVAARERGNGTWCQCTITVLYGEARPGELGGTAEV